LIDGVWYRVKKITDKYARIEGGMEGRKEGR
jgi:hypothetical protein